MVQGRKMTNYGPNQIRDLMISFERSLSKRSENPKINEIGSSKQKLMAVLQHPTLPSKCSPYLAVTIVTCTETR